MPTVMNPWPTSDPDPDLVPPPARASTPGTRGYHELTVDEMVADSEASDAAAGSGLAARLEVIRQSARDGGVSVTVDLYGKLVDLTIDQRAMRQRATDLAALIGRLTAQAAAAALIEGRAALTDAGIDPAITTPTAPDPASSATRRPGVVSMNSTPR